MPNQPTRWAFPQCQFGKKTVVKHSFQQQWFQKWRWLHYDVTNDIVFCHTCVKAVHLKRLSSTGSVDFAFISRGYSNWKDAAGNTDTFYKHESSSCHKEAVQVMYTLPQTTGDVGKLISSNHAKSKEENRKYLLKVAQSICYLAGQGLPLRGDGNEVDGNFNQLLLLRGIDVSRILDYLGKITDKYNSPQIQNDIIEAMADSVSTTISKPIQKRKYFSLMADEVTDSSKFNREQVVVCLRSVDDTFAAHEDFVCIEKVDSIKANVLVGLLKRVLKDMKLSLMDCRGQCYDSAANMAGVRTGVATQICEIKQRAVFTHCYGHALNLAAGDTMRQSKLLCHALDTVGEIAKLLKYSPRRDTLFEKLKMDLAPAVPSFRTLCPTRWTVKAMSLQSVIDNYSVFQELWVEAMDMTKDSEARSRVCGVEAQMTKFEFLFGLLLVVCILHHTDNLSKTLQTPKLSASDGQHVAELTCKTLDKMRTDDYFHLFWEKVLHYQNDLGVDEPVLPRKRKAPKRFEIGTSESSFSTTPEDLYHQKYMEAIDLVTKFIRSHFDQPGYRIYCNLENLLLKTAKGENYTIEIKFVVQFYGSDFDGALLTTQLELFTSSFSQGDDHDRLTLHDVKAHICSFSTAARCSMSEVCNILKILMFMPATNAVSERSASALR